MNSIEEVYKELEKHETEKISLTLADDQLLLLEIDIDGQNYLLSAVDDQLMTINKVNDNNEIVIYAHPDCDEIYNYFLDVMLNKVDLLEEIKIKVVPIKKKITNMLAMIGIFFISFLFTGILCYVLDINNNYIIGILIIIFYFLFSILLDRVIKKPKGEKD